MLPGGFLTGFVKNYGFSLSAFCSFPAGLWPAQWWCRIEAWFEQELSRAIAGSPLGWLLPVSTNLLEWSLVAGSVAPSDRPQPLAVRFRFRFASPVALVFERVLNRALEQELVRL
jgi:hypothetical protein